MVKAIRGLCLSLSKPLFLSSTAYKYEHQPPQMQIVFQLLLLFLSSFFSDKKSLPYTLHKEQNFTSLTNITSLTFKGLFLAEFFLLIHTGGSCIGDIVSPWEKPQLSLLIIFCRIRMDLAQNPKAARPPQRSGIKLM